MFVPVPALQGLHEAALMIGLQEDSSFAYIHDCSLIQGDGRNKTGSKIWLLCSTDYEFTSTQNSGLS